MDATGETFGLVEQCIQTKDLVPGSNEPAILRSRRFGTLFYAIDCVGDFQTRAAPREDSAWSQCPSIKDRKRTAYGERSGEFSTCWGFRYRISLPPAKSPRSSSMPGVK